MREHEIKALMGYLDRIADALERIAGTEDDAPERMTLIRPNPWDGAPEVVPQRVTPQQIMEAMGIEDLSLPEPERCGSIWDVEPLITCIRDEGHAGPHREVGGNSWGNYKDTPECDATLHPLGAERLVYCSRERNHPGDHHGMGWTWSPDSAIADDDPEQECADVSQARRHHE
jgi:hypothetical protein